MIMPGTILGLTHPISSSVHVNTLFGSVGHQPMKMDDESEENQDVWGNGSLACCGVTLQ
jgi:hypothetical protein